VAAWQTTDKGHYCTRHSYTFPRGEVCQACVTDPAPLISNEEPLDADDQQMAIWIAECETQRKALWRAGASLIGDPGDEGTDRDINAAAKAYAEGTKILRVALEMYEKRASRRHDKWLIEREREMSGVRRSN
jgi:hypothetical protein